MTRFKIEKHYAPDEDMVEVWIDGHFVAAIYADAVNGIRVVSKHVAGAIVDQRPDTTVSILLNAYDGAAPPRRTDPNDEATQ
jgi:hypothetical protein